MNCCEKFFCFNRIFSDKIFYCCDTKWKVFTTDADKIAEILGRASLYRIDDHIRTIQNLKELFDCKGLNKSYS